MPETLVFTTSNPALNGALSGDDVLVERSHFEGIVAFIQVLEVRGGIASAYLSLAEAKALNDQLVALILDAESR